MKTAFLGVSAQRSAQASRLSARKHVGATEFTRWRIGGSTTSLACQCRQLHSSAICRFLEVLHKDTPVGALMIVLCLAPTAAPKSDGPGDFTAVSKGMAH